MTDTLTILGKVATDPVLAHTTGGTPVTNFRLASTHRRYDSATQTWVDAGTNWYSVAAFRQLGEHAKASLRTGDSVIVTGRLKIRAWEAGGKSGTSVDIEADAIGHDLKWGTSAFLSASRAASGDRPRGSQSRAQDAPPVNGTDARDEGPGDDERSLDLAWAEESEDEAAGVPL